MINWALFFNSDPIYKKKSKKTFKILWNKRLLVFFFVKVHKYGLCLVFTYLLLIFSKIIILASTKLNTSKYGQSTKTTGPFYWFLQFFHYQKLATCYMKYHFLELQREVYYMYLFYSLNSLTLLFYEKICLNTKHEWMNLNIKYRVYPEKYVRMAS